MPTHTITTWLSHILCMRFHWRIVPFKCIHIPDLADNLPGMLEVVKGSIVIHTNNEAAGAPSKESLLFRHQFVPLLRTIKCRNSNDFANLFEWSFSKLEFRKRPLFFSLAFWQKNGKNQNAWLKFPSIFWQCCQCTMKLTFPDIGLPWACLETLSEHIFPYHNLKMSFGWRRKLPVGPGFFPPNVPNKPVLCRFRNIGRIDWCLGWAELGYKQTLQV